MKASNQSHQFSSHEGNLISMPHNPRAEPNAGHGPGGLELKPAIQQSNNEKKSRYPPEFWDRIPHILLTRSALKELDRRNDGSKQPYFPSPPTKPAHDPLSNGPKGLHRFARHGGPHLGQLRGYPPLRSALRSFLKSQPNWATDPRSTTTQSVNSTMSSTHDLNFGTHLTLFNIHPVWESQEPNLEGVYGTLAAPRSSLSLPQFSTQSFRTFQKSNLQAKNELDILEDVLPTILGTRDTNWPIARDMLFSHLEQLTDGTIPSAKPDFAYGALSEQLNPTIRTALSHFIAPGPVIPIVPNFFLEVKGPNGSAAINTWQACYDGAIGARAMHQLQNYKQEEPIYNAKPCAFSSTYHDGTLKLYAHHLTAPATHGGRPEYHMFQVKAYALTSDLETFIQGATAYRNLRDLAKQLRDATIEYANARYQQDAAAAKETASATTRGSRTRGKQQKE